MGHYTVMQEQKWNLRAQPMSGKGSQDLREIHWETGEGQIFFPSPLEEEEPFLMSVSTASVNISAALSEGHRNGWS